MSSERSGFRPQHGEYLLTSYDLNTPDIGLGPCSPEATNITEIYIDCEFGNSR
jgi:hypothetical protein